MEQHLQKQRRECHEEEEVNLVFSNEKKTKVHWFSFFEIRSFFFDNRKQRTWKSTINIPKKIITKEKRCELATLKDEEVITRGKKI